MTNAHWNLLKDVLIPLAGVLATLVSAAVAAKIAFMIRNIQQQQDSLSRRVDLRIVRLAPYVKKLDGLITFLDQLEDPMSPGRKIDPSDASRKLKAKAAILDNLAFHLALFGLNGKYRWAVDAASVSPQVKRLILFLDHATTDADRLNDRETFEKIRMAAVVKAGDLRQQIQRELEKLLKLEAMP